MATTSDAISQLAFDLEGHAEDSGSPLPSLQHLHRLGLVLCRIVHKHKNNQASINKDPVVIAYRELIECIPDESLFSLFSDIQKASREVLTGSMARSSGNNNNEDLMLGIRSVAGLICAYSDSDNQTCTKTESNSRLCRIVYTKGWVSTLSALFNRFVLIEGMPKTQQDSAITTRETETTKDLILSCISRLILDGLILVDESSVAESSPMEESLLDAIRSMEEESTDCLRDLQAWQRREEPFQRNMEASLVAIGGKHNDNIGVDEDEYLERVQQREYIISMLESAREEPHSMAIPTSTKEVANVDQNQSIAKRPNQSTGETELDRRIKQVIQILPHFGEGFVEVALGLHRNDVEATVAALLNHPPDRNSPSNSDYPAELRVLDPKLPRRKREFQAYQTAEEEARSAEEARRDVKERIAFEEKQKREQYEALVLASGEKQEAQDEEDTNTNDTKKAAAQPGKLTRKELRQQKLRKMREYDDDYDDQYDEIDIKLGGADNGFTGDNMTFEQIKLYNQAVQEDESDAAFWESNRNTNQRGDKKNNNNGEKQWGPDKIKGGRVVGPDGKIVRKPGGVKKKKANNNRANTNGNSNNNNNNNNNNKGGGGKATANNNNNNNNNSGNNAGASNGNKKKPKTKPRSDNRVNRQRDRKLKKQGAFGVQD